VTGPASGGTERGTRAPSRATGTQGAVGAVLVVLALGLALRLIIAYLLPGSGFEVDLNAFRAWAANLASQGPFGFYDRDFFHDYTPGYLYVLWLVGIVGHAIGGIGDLIKLPPILADLAVGWLAWSMVRELGGRDRLALGAAVVAVINPISWFDSVVWGQVDSFGVVFLMLGLRELWRDRPERAAIYAVIAAIIKPQLGILIPLVAIITIRRALWPAGGFGDVQRTGRPIKILTTGLAGFATAVLLGLPFGLTPIGLIQQVAVAGGTYQYITVNAYNPWAIVQSDLGVSLANAGLWVCDYAGNAQDCSAGVAVFGVVPAVAVGTALLVAAIGLILVLVARRPDRLTLLVGLAVLALAFFVLPTRVHERYGYPFFALGIILAAVSVRWRVAYAVLTVATFANMYVVLTTLYPDNPSIDDWLGIGPFIRSEPTVVVISLMHALAFVWAFVQFRGGARARLAEELEEASVVDAPADGLPGGELEPAGPDPSGPGVARRGAAVAMATPMRPVDGASRTAASPPTGAAPGAAAVVPMPTWTSRPTFGELGIIGWFRARIADIPIRPDRSATLRSERGGRLDRLDLWLVVMLVIGTLLLRTFRLAEPYQMHFDEVYHARTATEFLQDWRYGLSHDIYEWTHPHLAKYVMAAGIVLWGQDHVNATSDLGVPVIASVIEPRRADPAVPDGRAGERLHVATGSEIRTYDLRTRALVSVVPAVGADTLAIDSTGNHLILGYGDGRLATLDLTTLGSGGVDAGTTPTPLATVDHAVDHLLVTADGVSVVAASSQRLTVVALDAGTIAGSMDLPAIADLSPGGSGPSVVATVDDVKDAASLATSLADILTGDATDYAARLKSAAPGTEVVLGGPGTGDVRKALDKAISDGKLPGIAVDDVERVAVATANGVTFIDPSRLSKITTIALDGGAHGLALVSGLDVPKVYATGGDTAKPTYDVIAVGGDSAANGPTDQGIGLGLHPLPGPGTWITYDAASQDVHILGLAPRTATPASTAASGTATTNAAWTVYVVEPHGNAVYADARLPDGFEPSAWATDAEPDYPADDRQALQVFSGSGTMASIDIGSHAFAWRLPGVIAGAITAGLLYLLTRILFRRRIVAVLVALFVIADGMFFVQARIGMNDVYVGLFIVAAYTLFAAVWTGWWRGRAAFWLGMPVVGLLLGLGLASKWVAAYAMGAVVLLVLVRSALGRVLAILGLIGITGVLGYMALSVPEGAGFGNLTFVVIMVALTLLAVVVAVVHPIAWTDEEMRFALGAPAVLGTLVFFGALGTGRLDTPIKVGSLSVTPLLLAIGLAAGSLVVAAIFWLAGRWGFGPMARPPDPDDPIRLLDPPEPPPEGWLRPGWLLGLPVLWAGISLIVVPLVVYVIVYIPWAMVENHQLFPGWPPGHTGQTLADLTAAMYNYHNSLTDAHPASSPWWAWPMNLKPVWFYQESLGAGTSASLYDAGSLVIWWLGIPAMAFVSWMAFKRRSLALTLIAVGFAAQWIPWARIDRAAFQYHYYTALPFVVMGLAYFAAELWHGASRHVWLLARAAGALAIMAPALLWLLDRPLCAFVGVDSVNPGSQACPAVIPQFVLTARTAGLAVAIGIGLVIMMLRFVAFDRADGDEGEGGDMTTAFRSLLLTGVALVFVLIIVSLLPDTAILTLTNVPVEPIALLALIPLGYLGLQIFASRDARRFVVGLAVAVVGWFAILYPNISALPLPAAVVNAYQGILPTYLYAFQFPVTPASARNEHIQILTRDFVILLVALTATCLVVAYSAWVWRLTLADSVAANESGEGDGLARTGGA
jgi:predicted membrane-bound dolichyl-phosphate-mannose-protein mannosyltransferase